MLHIILIIFKIIGILLVSILGLLLIIVLLVCFVPFRYRIDANKKEEIKAVLRVSWLLHIISLRLDYPNQGEIFRVWVFGIPIRLEKGEGKRIKKTKKITKTQKTKKTTKVKKESHKRNGMRIEDIKDPVPRMEGSIETEDSIPFAKPSRCDKIKQLIHRLWNFIKRIMGFPKKVLKAWNKRKDVIMQFLNRIKTSKEFLLDHSNKPGFKLLKDSIIRLFKHAKPKKLDASVNFGTGDPCTTGFIMAALSVVYSFWGESLRIVPDFENIVFEGELRATGRIRMFAVLRIVIHVIRDDSFKKLRYNFNKARRKQNGR